MNNVYTKSCKQQTDLFDSASNSLFPEDQMRGSEGLVSLKDEFRIVRLEDYDAKYLTDNLNIFKNLMFENEKMYPSIQKWVNGKVIPGLRTKERSAFIGYLNEKPIVTAVMKKGDKAKFCHLKIYDEFQNNHLGELFFALMALEVRNYASEIHFTLPESLWVDKNQFFKSFGFRDITKAGTQYRMWDNELRCSAPFSVVWNSFIEKLPKLINTFSIAGYSMNNRLLMSIHPKYVNMILEGKKKVELRRVFSTKWINYRANLYSTSPECAIVGEALIKDVVADDPENIWLRYGSDAGCSKKEFDDYASNCDKMYALVLDDIRPYRIKVLLNQLIHLLRTNLTPPQSYSVIKEHDAWSNALSIATLMHSNYKVSLK